MDVGGVVIRAAGGDQGAWRELVGRYSGMVWAVARAHRLGSADAADVSQATWVALAEGIGGLRAPERVGAWLATTARRECLRVIREGRREALTAEWHSVPDVDERWRPEEVVLRTDRDDVLWRAFGSLGERCRRLLGLHAFAPELSRAELAGALGLAGSGLSKTKTRCLDVLRRRLAVMGLPEEAAG
ncbi:RNA polymerase sigma factor [Actinokineospora bangkokensis]|uniref:RNA polymerase sigma-70 region 2 domain-containing protein n=1 Tax=Actinokineospora bangkokensis TaxID=1193682 RepID=A0A1Q9LFI0_9PSEU|nr:sigma-70 family RNA polymerase sigma factor [Actinokineospora bangkokensis]OLR90778.1 hypothetical protein BJP25_29820 [Actinokineospora bangkokensis]